MILVVDSGSTKTDWIAVNASGETLFATQTLGLNPQVLSSAILKERMINNFDLYQNRKEVTHLYFYGAGCGVDSPQRRIKNVFNEIFVNSEIIIKEDTYAAVYAAAKPNNKSIVCILGTGSNCTYFDGVNIPNLYFDKESYRNFLKKIPLKEIRSINDKKYYKWYWFYINNKKLQFVSIVK